MDFFCFCDVVPERCVVGRCDCVVGDFGRLVEIFVVIVRCLDSSQIPVARRRNPSV
jgi:hypothetical protein